MRQRTSWPDDHVPLGDLAGIATDPEHRTPLNILDTAWLARCWSARLGLILLLFFLDRQARELVVNRIEQDQFIVLFRNDPLGNTGIEPLKILGAEALKALLDVGPASGPPADQFRRERQPAVQTVGAAQRQRPREGACPVCGRGRVESSM